MSTPVKAVLVLALCGWVLWKMVNQWLTPVVEPGRVTTLTEDNFGEVRRTAQTLIAIYMRPG